MEKKEFNSSTQTTHNEEGGEIVNKNLAKKGYVTGSSPVVEGGNIGGPGGSDAKPNAAVAVYAEAHETSLEDTRRVMDVNFFGQLHGVLAALPYLEKSGGQIIATLSVDSEVALPFHSAYVASKHALYGYYKVLHEELLNKRSPVKVSTILPASIATPFFEHAKTQLGVRPKPVPPVYSPQHVVKAMLKVAERPKFSTVVGGSGRNFIWFYRRFPNVFYRIQSWVGYPMQKSNEPKRPEDANNLYQPVPQSSRIWGTDKPSVIADFIESRNINIFAGLVGLLGVGLLIARRSRVNQSSDQTQRVSIESTMEAA
ncbi:MAG: SDR family NAD(P)-dependent oxidoreductase [Bdellovibrionia bacterium]